MVSIKIQVRNIVENLTTLCGEGSLNYEYFDEAFKKWSHRIIDAVENETDFWILYEKLQKYIKKILEET